MGQGWEARARARVGEPVLGTRPTLQIFKARAGGQGQGQGQGVGGQNQDQARARAKTRTRTREAMARARAWGAEAQLSVLTMGPYSQTEAGSVGTVGAI